MIRRLKSEVLTELPAKRRQRIVVHCEFHIMRQIHQALRKVKIIDDRSAEGSDIDGVLASLSDNFDEIITQKGNPDELFNETGLACMGEKYEHLMFAYRRSGEAKIRGINEFIETLIDNGTKFIVFAHHYSVLDAMEELVLKKKAKYIRIDGKIDHQKRFENVKKFQTDPSVQVGLLSLTSSS